MHKYFKLVNEQVKNDQLYISYKAVGYPMVLRSVTDGRYLASIHMFYDDQWEGSQVCPMIIELERPPVTDSSPLKQRYQVILPAQKDDQQVLTGRPIKYVITNLCHEGHIKIDLMRDDKPVDCVDPGGLNKVNELRPFESYEIKADQMNNSRKLMVKMKTKVATDGTTETVTLSDELSARPAEKVGDYLWITVTPRTGLPTLEKSFTDTIWTTSDYVIVSKPVPVVQSYDLIGGGSLYPLSYSASFASAPAPTQYVTAVPTSAPSLLCDLITRRDLTRRELLSDESDNDSDDVLYATAPAVTSSSSESYMHFVSLSADVETDKKASQIDSKYAGGANECGVLKPVALTETHAMTSKVGGYTHGDTISVAFGHTGISYRYDLHSPICVLGISFLEGDYTIPKPVLTKDEIDDLLTQYLAKLDSVATTEMLVQLKTMKTFKSEECVICLDRKPDVILMRCGHICTCKGECTNSLTTNVCPICRSIIIDRVDEKLLSNV